MPDATEQFADLTFPVQGIDLTSEFETQRTFTTPLGVNVRAYEPGTLRGRGGSRPGLSKYIQDTASNLITGSVIQHLNFIVDPTTDALIADDSSQAGNPDYILDPSSGANRNPGNRWVRRKGGGRQPNRKVPKPPLIITANDQTKEQGTLFTWSGSEFTASGLQVGDSIGFVNMWSKGAPVAAKSSDSPFVIYANGATGSSISGTPLATKYKIKYVPGTMTVTPATIQFVQGTQANPNTATANLAFTSPVATGDLLLVAVVTGNSTGASVVAITDTLGNSYTQVGSYVTTNAGNNKLSLWKAISASAGTNTVKSVASGNVGVLTSLIGILEYSGVASGAPDGTHTNTTAGDGTVNKTTGTVPVTVAGDLLVGVFNQVGGDSYTPGAGFTNRLTGLFLKVMDNTVTSVSTAVTATGNVPDVLGYCAIGASFKHA